LLNEITSRGLVCTIPSGTGCGGCSSWRNIIEGYVLAGEVTEINALTARALRHAADFTGDNRFSQGADRITAAINDQLWTGDQYLLNRYEGRNNPQITGDQLFPLFCGIAPEDRARKVLDRLSYPDFWNVRGMRTLPNTDREYNPSKDFGLMGGSWPNLTLWYAASAARYDPDAALAAIEMVARPLVDPMEPEVNVHPAEFSEWFDGDTGVNRGMHLSPWVAPTFIWAVLEGLLGLRWQKGQAAFHPNWPTEWNQISVSNMPSAEGPLSTVLERFSPKR
jgi:glycogen debranching enzyme